MNPIRTLDRPTPAVRGWTILSLAIAAWVLCAVAFHVCVAVAVLIGGVA